MSQAQDTGAVPSIYREQIADICRTGHYGIAETAVVNKLEALMQQVRLAARIEELAIQLNGYTASLKGKSAEFRYTMRPITLAIERRIAELEHQQTEVLKGGE